MYTRFAEIMKGAPFAPLLHEAAIAVGVSGGPDSMALAHLLSRWSVDMDGPQIHVVSVDHGLRPEAAAEAAMVCARTGQWPKIKAQVLVLSGERPQTKVQEAARDGRYAAMEAACLRLGVRFLCVAHHRDDQAETVLFRLAKGSGLDGLSAMRPLQLRGAVMLARPLLQDFDKRDILDYCAEEGIAYIDDPSNGKDVFARVRLRAAAAVLEKEGLSAKRLAVTAMRLDRARLALDMMAEDLWKSAILNKDTRGIVFNFSVLAGAPEEIVIRLILRAITVSGIDADADADVAAGEVASGAGASAGYGPRMERVEALVRAFLSDPDFKCRTLGGLEFRRKGDALCVSPQPQK